MGSRQVLQLVDGTADPAFAVDTSGFITAWNNAATVFFGIGATEAIGQRWHDLLRSSDEMGQVCPERCGIQSAIIDNRPVSNFDLQFETSLGRKWCNVSVLIANISGEGSRNAIHIVRLQDLYKRLEHAAMEFVLAQRQQEHRRLPPMPAMRWGAVSETLTPREIAILNRLALGQSTVSIANEFNISPATVRNHVKNVLRKLGAHTRLEAIRHAETAGLL